MSKMFTNKVNLKKKCLFSNQNTFASRLKTWNWLCFSCLDYLKPIAEEERKVEEAEKKAREEQERINKQLAEGATGTHTHLHSLSVSL